MVMNKWLSKRGVTSPLMSELTKNAKECGWQRPMVGTQPAPLPHSTRDTLRCSAARTANNDQFPFMRSLSCTQPQHQPLSSCVMYGADA